MMKEIWKDIEGYQGKYMVSNMGRVKSLKDSHGNYREKILKPVNNGSGYLKVELCSNGERKSYSIHRIVAETFLDNSNNLEQVNHKDENPMNNCVTNLEWCTAKYNSCYGTRLERFAKSKSKKVGCYKYNKLIKIYNALIDTEKDGFKKGAVCRCCKGKLKTHAGFTWRYID